MSRSSSSPAPKVYGWCPGALRPMMSGDGLVVRIRAPLGRLSQEQARAIAGLSQQHGNGLIDLSARANLQLRGISNQSHAAVIAGLQDMGLLDQDAATESRRNILLSPFWQPGDANHTIARSLERALKAAEDLLLPGKFGFVVDAGPEPQLQSCAADIRIERSGDKLLLIADGAQTGCPVEVETAAEAALDLARWFLDQGGASVGRGRMQALIARRAAPPSHSSPRSSSAPDPSPGMTAFGPLVALEFGQITAEAFARLADHGPLRLTPWRMILVEGAPELATLPGVILDATDPRLQVRVCTGAPGCLQALSPTRDLARDLAPFVPKGQVLHISGCAKGCAHPGPAPLALTATATDTFDLIHHGKASDQPSIKTLSASALRAAPKILTEGS
ncbi:precorrin-3B synthase [Pseudophaeobacter sp. TrK17]|uniref:precorrin-3B synthase n=1 Tax=Pseudophaeobacter sp. TrK17 TaxID=2815167 RepID=UPI0035D08D6D